MYAGTQFGRYEIRSKIGAGGMGEVYSALDHELERSVAIKLLPAEFTIDDDRRNRFRQEAKVVSALNHPNIITIYEIGQNEHGSFLATEFVEGLTLRALLKKGRVPLVRALHIVEQAANALFAAHNAGIIHRDIKPENIMIRQDSIVKVLDFGLAKPKVTDQDLDASESNHTLPGTVMGSAKYMSPEQARGREVDEQTDIWSLGVVLYELLSGEPPFEGESTADTIAAVVYREPEPLLAKEPNLPPELTRIVRKALQKDKAERYQSVKDMALDIRDVRRELEHYNSGDRVGHTTSSPNFNENPTLIHRTNSSGNLTETTRIITAGEATYSDRKRGKRVALAAFAFLGIAVLAAAGILAYVGWFSPEATQAARSFENPQISRVNTDGRVISPAISPDGRYVAFISGELGSRSLVVQQVATNSAITLVPESKLVLSSVSFSPSGDHLYYTQSNPDFAMNSLYSIPTLGGTPKLLLEDIDGRVTFSPDGKRFAFVRHVPKTNSDRIIMVDAATLEQTEFLDSSEAGYDFFQFRLAWSPDGRRLLTGAGFRESGFLTKTDIVEIAVDTKAVRKLNTREFFFVNNFDWFADGSGFVFTAREAQNTPSQVWRAAYPSMELRQITNDFNDYIDLGISADGGSIVTIKGDTSGALWRFTPGAKSARQLTSDSRGVEGMYGLAETPDGKLVFTRNEAKDSDLWIAGADGREQRALHEEQGYVLFPSVTPDGQFVVFNLQKDKRARIWRMNADGSTPVPLTEDGTDSGDMMPQLTPDGKSVIFQRNVGNHKRLMLMRVPIMGGTPEVLYENEKLGVFAPAVSPDGKRIAFASYNLGTFQKKLHIAELGEGRITKIDRELDLDLIMQFAWSPDGKSLTVLSNRGGTQNLWRMPLDGSEMQPLTDFRMGRIFSFVWDTDGRDLLISRGTTNNDLILIRDSDREMTQRDPRSGLRSPA